MFIRKAIYWISWILVGVFSTIGLWMMLWLGIWWFFIPSGKDRTIMGWTALGLLIMAVLSWIIRAIVGFWIDDKLDERQRELPLEDLKHANDYENRSFSYYQNVKSGRKRRAERIGY